MSTAVRPATDVAHALRRLYVARFAFAIVWAILILLVGRQLGVLTAVLVVLYPLVDVGSAVVDARTTTPAASSARGLHANVVISLLAAVGLLVAVMSGVPAVLQVWGAWAAVAGLVQLGVAVVRRELGGQWPMMASGAISVLAGVGFVVTASGPSPSLSVVAGYATLGGIFFLVSAIRLGRGRATKAV